MPKEEQKQTNSPEKVVSNSAKTVSVPEDKLQALIDLNASLQDRLKRLESSADKRRLTSYDLSHKGEIGKTVRLRTMNGKVIVGWVAMPVNICEKNPTTGNYYEEQKVKLIFEDGTDAEVPLPTYTKRYEFIDAKVKKEIKDGDETRYEVEVVDGRTFVVETKFLN